MLSDQIHWRVLAAVLGFGFLAAASAAEAQSPRRMARIGVLVQDKDDRDLVRQGLRELGYVEGQTIAVEWRSARDRPEHVSSSRPSS